METALYLPVKRFLEKLGFAVKGEVGGCDLVALSADDPPVVVIGELKLSFNLELILQARDGVTDGGLGAVHFGGRRSKASQLNHSLQNFPLINRCIHFRTFAVPVGV